MDDSRYTCAVVAVVLVTTLMALHSSSMGHLEFALCVVLLVFTFASLIMPPPRETFDSYAEIIHHTIMPSLDRLAKQMSDELKEEKEVNINAKHFEGLSESLAKELMIKYKRINMFLCNLRSIDLKMYDSLMSFLGAAPPEFYADRQAE